MNLDGVVSSESVNAENLSTRGGGIASGKTKYPPDASIKIYQSLSHGEPTALVLHDSSAAFYTADHDTLLNCLTL